MSIFNHCVECGARIPWRRRTYFGNSYKPVVCRACSGWVSQQAAQFVVDAWSSGGRSTR